MVKRKSIIYTQTIFQRPHFQFDIVGLIENVKLEKDKGLLGVKMA